jgi:SRSO17 transposase
MFEVLMGRIAGRFARVEPRCRARALVLGLLSDLPRKNCWTLAEHAGHASPDGLQHLLSRARWGAEAVRDDIRDFVVEQLHHNDAVLVVDETGDLKKGTATVGATPVHRDRRTRRELAARSAVKESADLAS